MRIENDIKLDFKDVLIRPKRSTLNSRSEVSLERSFTFKNSRRQYKGIPIVASNMDTIGTLETAAVMSQNNLFTAVHKFLTISDWEKFVKSNSNEILERIAVTTGITDQDLEKIRRVLEITECLNICVDVANGYTERFVTTIRNLRNEYPNHTIMAGNVVTGEMSEELILSGADIVKVGIGPGSVCTTRRMTGIGYPQLSAVIECADAAHGLGGHIISDGGCIVPGDIVKAFGAGSDFVMLGGMLSGHDESGGELIPYQDKKYKLFYGMSSEYAMNQFNGGVAQYRASEGKAVCVEYKGPLENTIKEILGGLRSACTYVGASELRELSKRTTFVRVTQQLNPKYGESSSDLADRVLNSSQQA